MAGGGLPGSRGGGVEEGGPADPGARGEPGARALILFPGCEHSPALWEARAASPGKAGSVPQCPLSCLCRHLHIVGRHNKTQWGLLLLGCGLIYSEQ